MRPLLYGVIAIRGWAPQARRSHSPNTPKPSGKRKREEHSAHLCRGSWLTAPLQAFASFRICTLYTPLVPQTDCRHLYRVSSLSGIILPPEHILAQYTLPYLSHSFLLNGWHRPYADLDSICAEIPSLPPGTTRFPPTGILASRQEIVLRTNYNLAFTVTSRKGRHVPNPQRRNEWCAPWLALLPCWRAFVGRPN